MLDYSSDRRSRSRSSNLLMLSVQPSEQLCSQWRPLLGQLLFDGSYLALLDRPAKPFVAPSTQPVVEQAC